MIPIFPFVAGQTTGKPVHPTHAAIPVNDAPVSAREARACFVRAAALLSKVNGRTLGLPLIPEADRVATRSEIVAEMGRLYAQAEPTLRFTPLAVPHDPSRFRIDAGQRTTLEKLVIRGCVARIGPLAVGPSVGLSPKELGDAVGFFMARIGQMSHLPSPQWTPILQAQ